MSHECTLSVNSLTCAEKFISIEVATKSTYLIFTVAPEFFLAHASVISKF